MKKHSIQQQSTMRSKRKTSNWGTKEWANQGITLETKWQISNGLLPWERERWPSSSSYFFPPNKKQKDFKRLEDSQGYQQQAIGHLPSYVFPFVKGKEKLDLDKNISRIGGKEYDMEKTSWVLLVWAPHLGFLQIGSHGFNKDFYLAVRSWCSASDTSNLLITSPL